MSNTKNLDEALQKAQVELPGESKIKVLNPVQENSDSKYPAVIASNIVLTHGINTTYGINTFELPKDSFKVVNAKPEDIVNVHYTVSPPATNLMWILRHTVGSIYPWQPGQVVPFSQEKLGKVVWELNPTIVSPEVVLYFSVGSNNTPGTESKMVISYNYAPLVEGETVVERFTDIKATDREGHFVGAFELKLANEDLCGKVGVAIHDPMQPPTMDKIYPIGKEGLRYTHRDRVSMRLVPLDGYTSDQEGLAKDHVRVNVRACDSFAWGESTLFHVRIN